MKIKIIATGISGLVGSRIVELLGNKYEFINFSLDTGINIIDRKLLEKRFNQYNDIKYVLHLAAFTNVDEAFKQKGNKNGSCYKVNVIGSKNIAQICKIKDKFIVHISTDFIFNGKNTPRYGYTETNKPNPIEWYGRTKYLAEQEFIKSGCKYIILRIAFPYKAKFSPKKLEPVKKLDLVRNIIAKLKQKQSIHLFTDLLITPTFIDDIAKVINSCLTRQPTGIYHCVGSASLSPHALALMIADTFGLDKTLVKKASFKEFITKHPQKRPRQKNLKLSNRKLLKELGIRMSAIDEGLRECARQINS